MPLLVLDDDQRALWQSCLGFVNGEISAQAPWNTLPSGRKEGTWSFKRHCRRKPVTTFIFLCLLLPMILSALYNIIHDCDEVYNYWEPLHFLLYGHGMQTWEYR